MQPRIMYTERKSDVLGGPARIDRVSFSKTGKTLYYGGRRFESLRGAGYKANYVDVESGAEYWISGCKKRGGDRLYGGMIEIDDDVREEYWTVVRKMPDRAQQRRIRCMGKHHK